MVKNAEKDVDGVTCLGFGRMAMGEEAYGSATPAGIMRIIEHFELDLTGKHAVVVGRSPILGKPMALMLLNKNATVTICHSRTADLASHTRKADGVVAAVGRSEMITDEHISEGTVVIDVGINRGDDGKLRGDVDFAKVSPLAKAITPVPGGVGPMTIAMLMHNTCLAHQRRLGIEVES